MCGIDKICRGIFTLVTYIDHSRYPGNNILNGYWGRLSSDCYQLWRYLWNSNNMTEATMCTLLQSNTLNLNKLFFSEDCGRWCGIKSHLKNFGKQMQLHETVLRGVVYVVCQQRFFCCTKILCYSRREWRSYYHDFRLLNRRMSSHQSSNGDQCEDQPDGTTDSEKGIDTPAPKMLRLGLQCICWCIDVRIFILCCHGNSR